MDGAARYAGGGASFTRKYVDTGAGPEYAMWNGMRFGEHVGNGARDAEICSTGIWVVISAF